MFFVMNLWLSIRRSVSAEPVLFCLSQTMLSFMRIMQLLKEQEVPFQIFGKGSNLLCSDDAYHGVVVCLDRYLNNFYFEEDGTLVAEAGCSIILLASGSDAPFVQRS